jgi:arylformamidase
MHERQHSEDFESQFNPRAAVPEFADVMRARIADSEAARLRFDFVPDVRYGDAARATMDVFPAPQPRAAVIYVHGGYWRAGCARDNSAVAIPFAEQGIAVFLPNYSLCPAVTVATIVDEIRSAIRWVRANARRYGGEPAHLYVAGTSAGAHLAAMALAADDGIEGACLISGVFDLAPVLRVSVNSEIGLTESDALSLSPMRNLPVANPSLLMAVGARETPLWIRQTLDYASRCRARGLDPRLVTVDDANHFSIVESIYKPGGALREAMLDQVGA